MRRHARCDSPCCGSDRNAGPWPGCSSGWRPWGWSPRSTQSPAQRRHRQSYGGDRCAVGPKGRPAVAPRTGTAICPPCQCIPATRRPPQCCSGHRHRPEQFWTAGPTPGPFWAGGSIVPRFPVRRRPGPKAPLVCLCPYSSSFCQVIRRIHHSRQTCD